MRSLGHAKAGALRRLRLTGADGLLSLAAAPTFAVMALVTGLHEGDMPGILCSAAYGASPWTGMVAMYGLMSVFHLAPWLRLIADRPAMPSGGRQTARKSPST